MPKEIVKGFSVRRKLLAIVTSLITGLVIMQAYIQASGQSAIIERETGRRIELLKQNLTQRAKTTLASLKTQVESGIASFNFSSIADALERADAEDEELIYLILMDANRVAHIHTGEPGLAPDTLSGKEDIFAATQEELTINEYQKKGKGVLELISPIYISSNRWGTLRLGVSLEKLDREIETSQSEIKEQVDEIVYLSTAVAVATLTVSFIWLYLFLSQTVKPIETLRETMQLIEVESDLTKRIEVSSRDEIGQAAFAFNAMLETFQKIIKEMALSADHLASATTQLSASTERGAGQALVQSNKVAAMTSSIDEVNMAIASVAGCAVDLAKTAGLTRRYAIDGGKIIDDSMEAIKTLSDYSTQIDSVVLAIEDIAKKNDLLAINAAIEAANAGVQGAGFAVVADEVRKLSERTTRATKEIYGMVTDIRTLTANVVDSMKNSTRNTEMIIAEATQVNKKADQIASESERHASVTNAMLDILKEVRKLSHGFSSQAEQTKQVSSEISDQSIKLQRVVDRFKS